jgi:hypothetical protein
MWTRIPSSVTYGPRHAIEDAEIKIIKQEGCTTLVQHKVLNKLKMLKGASDFALMRLDDGTKIAYSPSNSCSPIDIDALFELKDPPYDPQHLRSSHHGHRCESSPVLLPQFSQCSGSMISSTEMKLPTDKLPTPGCCPSLRKFQAHLESQYNISYYDSHNESQGQDSGSAYTCQGSPIHRDLTQANLGQAKALAEPQALFVDSSRRHNGAWPSSHRRRHHATTAADATNAVVEIVAVANNDEQAPAPQPL